MNVLKHIYFWVDERLEMHDYIKKDILDKPIPKGLNLSLLLWRASLSFYS